MDGYIQALIDLHYRRLNQLNSNQDLNKKYEISFIEELENIQEFYLKKEVKVEVIS